MIDDFILWTTLYYVKRWIFNLHFCSILPSEVHLNVLVFGPKTNAFPFFTVDIIKSRLIYCNLLFEVVVSIYIKLGYYNFFRTISFVNLHFKLWFVEFHITAYHNFLWLRE